MPARKMTVRVGGKAGRVSRLPARIPSKSRSASEIAKIRATATAKSAPIFKPNVALKTAGHVVDMRGQTARRLTKGKSLGFAPAAARGSLGFRWRPTVATNAPRPVVRQAAAPMRRAPTTTGARRIVRRTSGGGSGGTLIR
jgi:hypothetical protein